MLSKDSKIYIAGHHGLVGSAIWNNLKKRGYNNLVGRSHKELDLTDQYAPSLSCSCQAATIRSSARTATRLARAKSSCCASHALCSPIRLSCCWTRRLRVSIRAPSCRCRRHSTSSWLDARALSWHTACRRSATPTAFW